MVIANEESRRAAEIVNLRLAARSFKEAANELRVQRDEARREAVTLRRRMRIAAVASVLAPLLVAGIALQIEAAEDAAAPLPKHSLTLERSLAAAAAPRSVHGTILSPHLTVVGSYIVYKIVVAGKGGAAHEISADADTGTMLQQESDEPDPGDPWRAR